MPIFDYRCGDCGDEQEKLVKNAEQDVECPKCGGRMKKMPAAPGNFNTTGIGFHKPTANCKTRK